MAKSNETFKKKEKEKKRLKKQQEKREKAEQRKLSSIRGKSLDDMMAYLDENGNITSTPPAFLKKVIAVEDIAISVPKRVAEQKDMLKTGVISFFNTAKGYGFIREEKTRDNIFFHVNKLTYDGKENDKVNFGVEKGLKGLNATDIKKAK